MEIELIGLTRERLKDPLAVLLASLALAIILGLVGSHFTTTNTEGAPEILSWNEWKILIAERAYRAELLRLQQEADLLVASLNRLPDPVRAQLAAERITRQYTNGEPALKYQREAVTEAAVAVQDWAAGVLPRDQAAAAVNEATRALKALGGTR